MLRVSAVVGLPLIACQGFGQSTAAPRPEFEVASINLDKSGDSLVNVPAPHGGRFTATNIPLQYLISTAYRFPLSGAPAWLLSDRYDIEAKADGNPTFEEMFPMLQRLFEDRLRLRFHHETKERPIYALVVAKAGKLHESQVGCGATPSPAPCRFMILPRHLGSQKATIAQLVDALSNVTGRVVVDRTNLTGTYDINLDYTPEHQEFHPSTGAARLDTPPLPPIDLEGPSLFTALQEQLGLKLEPQKGPVDIMIIDHVERPSEN
jgi:uncharacterized protein (TIGR03435 family)